MTGRHAWLVVVLAIAGTVVARAWQKPSFRSRTVVVSVNVSVKQGRHPVADLTSAEFELLDNGVRQQVDAVSLERVPIDVTMVLTGYPKPQAAEHLRGLVSAEEIRRLLPVTDRLRVVHANDRIRGRLVEADYVVPGHHPNPPTIPGVALTDGLFYALAWPVDADRRHLVVAFTNGQDSYSVIESDRLPALVDRSDAVLHAVLWSSPSASVQPSGRAIMFGNSEGSRAPSGLAEFPVREWERTFRTLMNAVTRSGGTLRHAAADASAFQAVLDDFRTSYVLSYSPRGVSATGWHELTVKVRRRGSFTVRARKGYEAN